MVLDPAQLARIEATHSGSLYQHLFGAAQLLVDGTDAELLVAESDEDIEIETTTTHQYVQVKYLASVLQPSEVEPILDRVTKLRAEHIATRRPRQPRFAIVSASAGSSQHDGLFLDLDGSGVLPSSRRTIKELYQAMQVSIFLLCTAHLTACKCDPDALRKSMAAHAAGTFVGDYVKTSAPAPEYIHMAPQVVYLQWVDWTSAPASGLPLPSNSPLLTSLTTAGLRDASSSTTLQPLSGSREQLKARGEAVLALLSTTFLAANVVFTFTKPSDPIFWPDLVYMTIEISASPASLARFPIAVSSYSIWDPKNTQATETSYVFDTDPLGDPSRLANEISHTVGHALGLNEVSEATSIMYRKFPRGSNLLRNASVYNFAVDSGPSAGECYTAAAAQSLGTEDELALVQAAVGVRRTPSPSDGGVDGNVFLGVPPGLPPDLSTPATDGLGHSDSALRSVDGCTFRNLGLADSVAYYSCATGGDVVSANDSSGDSWSNSAINIEVVGVPYSTGAAPVDADQPTQVVETGGGGGSASNPALPPKDVVNKPASNTAKDWRKCKLDEFRAYTKHAYANVTFSFAKNAPDNTTNCTKFLKDYVERSLGIALSPTVETQFYNGDYAQYGRLKSLVAEGAPVIRGPQRALVGAGLADPVADLTKLQPGDVAQAWFSHRDGTLTGHQGIVSSVARISKANGVIYYRVNLFGSQPGDPPGTVFSVPVVEKDGIFYTTSGTVKMYGARFKQTPTSKPCN